MKRQISDPVDLTQTYDSIRRRSANFPPSPPQSQTPPLTTTNNNNNNHHQFSFISNKQSSLTPLVEGDV
jgi:hypothetical protein